MCIRLLSIDSALRDAVDDSTENNDPGPATIETILKAHSPMGGTEGRGKVGERFD